MLSLLKHDYAIVFEPHPERWGACPPIIIVEARGVAYTANYSHTSLGYILKAYIKGSSIKYNMPYNVRDSIDPEREVWIMGAERNETIHDRVLKIIGRNLSVVGEYDNLDLNSCKQRIADNGHLVQIIWTSESGLAELHTALANHPWNRGYEP